MAPSMHARPQLKVWFTKLWEVEKADGKFLNFKPSCTPVLGEDGRLEVLRHSLQVAASLGGQTGQLPVDQENLESEFFEDGEDATVVVEDEVRDAIANMLNCHEQQILATPAPTKVSPTVAYKGHLIYKSTLVSQLNGNPFLSKDRLTRV